MAEETITKVYPFSSAPRQIAFPQRIPCYNTAQFMSALNKYNGLKKKMYYSVYRHNEYGNFQDLWDEDILAWRVDIDCIPFDFDNERCLHNIRKVFEYCEKNDLRSMYTFSTRGFWSYIRSDGYMLNNPKIALDNAQRFLANEIGLTIGKSEKFDIDQSCIGDIARITRAINTRDTARGRFCIVLSKDDLYKTYDEICELSKHPRFEYYVYGSKKLEMKDFDSDESAKQYRMPGNDIFCDMSYEELSESEEKLLENFSVDDLLPCVRYWLTNNDRDKKYDGWKSRYFFAVYCAQDVIHPQVCDALAKKYFSKMSRHDEYRNNYIHFKRHNIIRQSYQEDKFFPNCDYLIERKMCPGKCEKYAGKGSPLYYDYGGKSSG